MRKAKVVLQLLCLAVVLGAVFFIDARELGHAVVVAKAKPVAAKAPKPEDVLYDAAREFGVPMVVAWHLAHSESAWNPEAVNTNGRSDLSNADLGLMQINVNTARDYGIKQPLQLLTDLRLNTKTGMHHLSKMFAWAKAETKLERWRMAVAAYKRGKGNWRAGLKKADIVISGVVQDLGELIL